MVHEVFEWSKNKKKKLNYKSMKTLETEEIYKESVNVKVCHYIYIKKDTIHLLSSLLNELFVVLVVCVNFIVHI